MGKYGLIVRTDENFGDIRVAVKPDGDILLHAKDCATGLGFKNSRKAMSDHVDKSYISKLTNSDFGCNDSLHPKLNNRGEIFITREGFIELVMGSKLKEAKKFKKWILEEVIPSIIDTGEYKASKKAKKMSAYKLLGKEPSESFKRETGGYITKIAITKRILKGKVWKRFVTRYNSLFNTNLTIRKNHFEDKYNLKKMTMREFLDVIGDAERSIMCLKSLVLIPDENLTKEDVKDIKMTADFLVDEYYEDEDDIEWLESETKRLMKKLRNIKTKTKKKNKDEEIELVRFL